MKRKLLTFDFVAVPRFSRLPWLPVALLLIATMGGCAIVPQNRRAHLADPMMSFNPDPTETYRKQKFYNTREGAAGGDGEAAGGGCGCQ